MPRRAPAELDPHRYGPWALVAGASDGVGAAFAEEIAAAGIGVVLVARRQQVLDEVAAGIRARTGAHTRTVAVDLSATDAAETVLAATSDLDIGLLVYCAGADPHFQPFLDNTLQAAEQMVQRNVVVPMQLAHRLGRRMADRGRGGIVVLSSGAAFVGAPNMATYGATKAFDMVFAEALWCELRDRGVDALSVVLGQTDTPAHRRLRAERGIAAPDQPVPRSASPAQVVATAFAHLGRQPVCMAGADARLGARVMFPLSRPRMVRLMERASRRAMGGG